jgi:dephospho-CoA kinase
VEPGTPALQEITATFGPEVLREDGSLDRDAMARLVFPDGALRAKLNAIVHPRVGEQMAKLERAVPEGSVVIFDVPLLAENNLAGGFEVVVVVDAPRHTQLDRLVRLRGMTKEQAASRIAAQASRQERLAVVGDTGFVIDNSGSLAELDRQVGDLWAELRRRATQRRAG